VILFYRKFLFQIKMLEGQEDQMVLMYLCRKKRFITHFVLDQLGLEKWLQNIMIKVIMYKHNRKFIFKGYSTKIITIVVFHRLINKSILLKDVIHSACFQSYVKLIWPSFLWGCKGHLKVYSNKKIRATITFNIHGYGFT
jgi:hypothetical protein